MAGGGSWITTAADVFSSVGTVGAFAVGMVLLRKEHRREEHADDERRRGQAVMVSAWLEPHRDGNGVQQLAFHVHNASGMPIYEVSLSNQAPGTGDDSEAEFIGLVPPGQTARRPAPREWARSYFSPEPVEVEFLDSGGVLWRRDEQGLLTEVQRSGA